MSLRAAVFDAGRWTTASVLSRGLLQLAQTMILARLLTPADFGLMAIIFSVHAIVSLFVDLGISNALIHLPDPSPVARSTLYWLNLGAAVAMMLATMALAWPAASLYAKPELLGPMLALALALPLGALGQQFSLLAEKDLRFSTLARIELAAAGCGFVAAVCVAMLGGGVYALVASSLVTPATSSALAWIFLSEGLRPGPWFDLATVKAHVRYGAFRVGETLTSTAHSQADVLIGGAVAGADAMGLYTLPRNLTQQLANSLVNPVVTRVGLPVMAKLQADRAALASVYLQTLRMTASVNFPLYAVLAIWAHDVVGILLGGQWHEAGDFLRLFALWGLIRSTGNPVGSLLYGTGRVRVAFWWNLALLLLVPGALAAGVMLDGTRGLVVSMVCIQLAIFYPMFRLLVHPASGISFREYTGALLPPLGASAAAAAVGLGASSLVAQPSWLSLAVGGAAAGGAYLAISRFVNRPWWRAMSELLHPVWHRG